MNAEKRPLRWPIVLALTLLVVFAAIFVILFVVESEPQPEEQTTEITAESYVNIVMPLLADANPENGEALLNQYGCAACHVLGALNNVAPSFSGLGERAAERRPPLTAEAYLYESIVHPSAFVVEGYPASMAQDYGERLTDEELGDIIAYLRTR
jgi:mono/diheme cytochrome c family protein